MQPFSLKSIIRHLLPSFGVFAGSIAAALLLWWVGGSHTSFFPSFYFWLVAVPVSCVLSWLVGSFLELRQKQRSLQSEMDRLERQLDGAIQLNRVLVNTQDERQLIEQSLALFTQFTGAVGSTFMPMDEWGQPLEPYAHGKLPQPVLKGWAEHLVNHSIRKQCRECQERFAPAGSACPLMETPVGGKNNIFCFPVWFSDRMIGMMNLYLPADQDLSAGMHHFIEGLLEEFALTMDALRLRNQERTTLKYLQLGRPAQTDMVSLLSDVMDSVKDALDVDGLYLDIRSTGATFPGLQLIRGNAALFDFPEVRLICQSVYANPDRANGFSTLGPLKTVLVIPLRLPEGQVVGVLLVGKTCIESFPPKQVELLSTVAAQAALLVESERSRVTLELRSVLQERIRLAREIHDGLAQTLAFLKLNAAQMQTYLARQDLGRLDQALRHSYQTLSEAYLDMRQVIDHLRASPEQGLIAWMEQLCEDFEQTSGLIVERSCPPIHRVLSPEVQSQLMRVVQEAFNNIRKHANARRVQVSLREWQSDFVLEVQDDGEGFLPEDVPALSRHGLRGMQERAELIGADFQIISQPGQGTKLVIRIPGLQEEKNE